MSRMQEYRHHLFILDDKGTAQRWWTHDKGPGAIVRPEDKEVYVGQLSLHVGGQLFYFKCTGLVGSPNSQQLSSGNAWIEPGHFVLLL